MPLPSALIAGFVRSPLDPSSRAQNGSSYLFQQPPAMDHAQLVQVLLCVVDLKLRGGAQQSAASPRRILLCLDATYWQTAGEKSPALAAIAMCILLTVSKKNQRRPASPYTVP